MAGKSRHPLQGGGNYWWPVNVHFWRYHSKYLTNVGVGFDGNFTSCLSLLARFIRKPACPFRLRFNSVDLILERGAAVFIELLRYHYEYWSVNLHKGN
jgi:hypothetical protein